MERKIWRGKAPGGGRKERKTSGMQKWGFWGRRVLLSRGRDDLNDLTRGIMAENSSQKD